MTKTIRVCALASVLVVVLVTRGQGPQDQVIRVASNLVAVPVLVTDSSGKPVRDLSLADFRLEKDGQVQRIVRLGEAGSAPVELALLLDVSGSVSEKFKFEQQAAAQFLRSVIRPVDTVSVFSIGRGPRLVQARTGDVSAAVDAVMALRATREPTAFYDTIVESSTYLSRSREPGTRHVVVAITDGEDNNSERAGFEETLQAMSKEDCLFYSINPSGQSLHLNVISEKAQERMAAMASGIGGAFVVSHDEELTGIFEKIAAELQAQYMIGFYFNDERSDGRYRQLAVSVPGRPDLRVRARQGYYAPKGSW